MTNIFSATKPERKLVSLSIQDENGTWIDISKFIPCFELEPVTQTNQVDNHNDKQ